MTEQEAIERVSMIPPAVLLKKLGYNVKIGWENQARTNPTPLGVWQVNSIYPANGNHKDAGGGFWPVKAVLVVEL